MIFILFTLFSFSLAYKPIIYVHGMGGSSEDVHAFEKYVYDAHPGTKIYPLKFYPTLESFIDLYSQVTVVKEKLTEAKKQYNITGEYILLCHSQGSSVCRSVIQELDDHGVTDWISTSGTLNGIFGVPQINFPVWLRKYTLEELSDLFYLPAFQHSICFANYWKDPYQYEKYLAKNLWLSIYNNETYNKDGERQRNNFLKLKNIVLFASPCDTEIRPWQTAHFAQYKLNDMTKVIPMEEQEFYVNDYFGLKTLNEAKKITIVSAEESEKINHNDWYQKVPFHKYVLPHLT